MGAALRAWRDAKIRGALLQGVILVLVVAFFAFIVRNAAVNLEERGIASGFAFLSQPASYDISFSLVPYAPSDTHGRVLLVGILNTLLVSALGIVLCTVLGVVLGVLRLSGNWLVARMVMVYVEIVRNVPLLLQIFFWYGMLLGLPHVRESLSLGGWAFLNNRGLNLARPVFEPGMGWVLGAFVLGLAASIWLTRRAARLKKETGRAPSVLWPVLGLVVGLPAVVFLLAGLPLSFEFPQAGRFNIKGGIAIPQAFFALLVALTLYTAAFVAENVRAGIQAVSKGQREAASALGLSGGQTMRLVILPQALRVIIPPLTNQYLNLFKNSSLGVAIGFPELIATFAGTSLNQTGQAIETLFVAMGFYLVVSLLVSFAMNLYNRAVALKER